MQFLLGLVQLARTPQWDKDWNKDLCMRQPGVQCTLIRTTNKFDMHDDHYTAGAILINVANYLREEIDATPLDGDTYGASATYELSLNDGKATRQNMEFQRDDLKVPGLGAASDGQKYQVKCGRQEWARRLGLCTFHVEHPGVNVTTGKPISLNPQEASESVALGNFPMPHHFKPGPLFDNVPASFYSSSLSTLFVLFPTSNASSSSALELIRIPILKEDSVHWDERMERLNGGMGRNFTLCSVKPCSTGAEYRHMTTSTFHVEHLGVTFGTGQQKMVLYDDLQVIGLQGTSAQYDQLMSPSRAECCDTSGKMVPNCANFVYFHYAAPCEHEGNPECTEAEGRGLLPLPNLGSLTTLVDARYAPAMIYTCSSDGANGINVTATNIANIPDPYCTPLDGRSPADCQTFDHKPSLRTYRIPSANINTEPFLEETPAGVPVWIIVILIIFGCLVLFVAVVLPLLWLLQQMKKHKYQTVA